jgi:hypothetical protein
MKITGKTPPKPVEVEIAPFQIIEAMECLITAKINTLCKEECISPKRGGVWESFYIGRKGELMAYWSEGRHPRESEERREVVFEDTGISIEMTGLVSACEIVRRHKWTD